MKGKELVIRGVKEGIVTIAVCFFLLSLIGCKTPIRTERNTQISSVTVKDAFVVNYDSIIQHMLSSLSYEYEYKIVKYSKPDEDGGQHVEEEHNIKGVGRADKEISTTHINKSESSETETNNTESDTAETIAPVKVLSWWDKLRLKGAIIIICVVIGCALTLWGVKKLGLCKYIPP